MPIDSSIALQVRPFQMEAPANQLMRLMQMQHMQQQGDLADVQVQQQRQALEDDRAIRQALQGVQPGEGYLPSVVNKLQTVGNPAALKQAQALQAAEVGRQFKAAETARANAAAGKDTQATTEAKRKAAMAEIASLNGPDDAIQHISQQVTAGAFPMQYATALTNMIKSDPKWQVKLLLAAADPAKAAELLMPQLGNEDQGGTRVFTSRDKLTGAVTTNASIPITQSANNAATNATSRENNRDTIAKDLQVAGIAPGGGLDDNAERTAQAIASGQLPAPTGMALLNPKNQRILGRVMEINPDYDSTTVDAKRKAARDFTSGPLGNALRSVATANAHLDQLGELADALQNGNMQVVNRVSNWYKQQTGEAAPTNFDGVRNIVGQEVVKAIVPAGGSLAERDEAAKAFSRANSPAQLKELIQHFRMVMGAQQKNLLEQRRAAGLPDSTLPKYTPDAPGASSVMDAADAIIRGGK